MSSPDSTPKKPDKVTPEEAEKLKISKPIWKWANQAVERSRNGGLYHLDDDTLYALRLAVAAQDLVNCGSTRRAACCAATFTVLGKKD